jgi:membrane fusion protein (multidrug efflux system)
MADELPQTDHRSEGETPSDVGRTEGGSSGGEGATSDDKRGAGERRRPGRLPLIILAVAVVILAIGGGWYYLSTRNQETTDDAFTDGNAVTIAPQVSGYVVELNINDNTRVKAGDLMVRIDPREFVAARDQAAAALAVAKAQAKNARINLQMVQVTAPARLAAAKAQLAGARANRRVANLEAVRQTSLGPNVSPQTAIDTAVANALSSGATVDFDRAQVAINQLVQQEIDQAKAQLAQLEAQVQQAQAQLAQAEIDLSYTELRAPQDGWVTRRNVNLGTYLQAGQEIFALVTPEVWVTANFKETQLDRMRPGQQVRISVDGYPDLPLRGHVDSLQMGTGSVFSLFPAENATGNFVHIVQRVPVKIVIDSGLDPNLPLPLGLSVRPTVELE